MNPALDRTGAPGDGDDVVWYGETVWRNEARRGATRRARRGRSVLEFIKKDFIGTLRFLEAEYR